MKSQLRILIVADPASDAELLIRELRRGGYEPFLERAETLDAIDAALGKHNWDVIFAEHPMPRFNLAEALALIRDRDPEVPVIILTSRIAEEEAAAAMKAGADDYIIYLPRVEQSVDSDAPVAHSGAVPCGTETVLLVEDDLVVRQLAKIALAEQGYNVLEASDGEQALRVAAENGDRHIALLVTDVVMPLMGGKELTDRIKSSRPNMKVLFVSGYADDAAAPRGSSNWSPAFLQKPFAPSALALKVRQTLDG